MWNTSNYGQHIVAGGAPSNQQLLARRRRENGQHDQALRAGSANRMKNAGRRKCGVTGAQPLLLAANGDEAGALQDEVQFILPFMRVRCVFLAGLKRVQAGEKGLAFGDPRLAHPGGIEARQAGYISYEHHCLV
jgi:hypothetical protein